MIGLGKYGHDVVASSFPGNRKKRPPCWPGGVAKGVLKGNDYVMERKFLHTQHMLFPSDRWEQGSEFHLMLSWPRSDSPKPWGQKYSSYGSGRQALQTLIRFGQAHRGWQRLWIPSYFCQIVVAALLTTGIELKLYPDSPWNSKPDLGQFGFRPGDVLLLMNFFGLRARPPMPEIDRGLIEIIENHSHDLGSKWAWSSDADWCVASLRKTLPLPDGGILWSPAGHSLPPAVPLTSEHQVSSLKKLAAMTLKALYLNGHPIEKEKFRHLAILGEGHIGTGEPSGMLKWTSCLFTTFPMEIWRQQRRLNHQILSAGLADLPWVEVLQPEDNLTTFPFSGILVFDSPERRARVRQKLMAAQVYPAILWPLDEPVVKGISPEDLDFSQRMLSIHCDLRYGRADMEYVSYLIREYGNG